MQFINNKFFSTKYFLSCVSYGLLMGSSIALRVSLIFILSFIFLLSDSEKFLIYSSFTVATDLIPILSSYLTISFLTSRISAFIGFGVNFLGIIIFSFSLLNSNLIFFYLGLAFISTGLGIARSNLMSINSEYLNLEFTENKKEFGSLLYFSTVFSSFLVVFLGGFFLKQNLNYIIFIISGLSLFSSLLFFYTERNSIFKNDEKLNLNFRKTLISLLIIFGSIFLAFGFYFIGQINFLFNLPIIFFISFYAYLIYRARKNTDEKESIWFAISVSVLISFFVMLERQRDTSIALFVLRNMNYVSLGLSPIQINAIFSIFMLSINLIFFKIKLHSKISLSKLFFLTPLLIFLSFGILYVNCFFSDGSGKVSFIPYLFSMIFMASSSVLVFARYSEVCAFSIAKIRILISSFMITSMGLGFYLTRFIGKFMEIKKENTDPFYSLEIYKSGFLKISIICLIFFCFSLILNFYKSKLIKINKINQ